jgi:hypothetical protein
MLIVPVLVGVGALGAFMLGDLVLQEELLAKLVIGWLE